MPSKNLLCVFILVLAVISFGDSRANVVVGEPGCYVLTGVLKSLNSVELQLLTFPGTRSEAPLTIKFSPQPSPRQMNRLLKLGSALRLEVQALRKGSATKVPLTVKAESISSISKIDALYDDAWKACR